MTDRDLPGATPESSCIGKVAFDSAQIAWKAAGRKSGRIAYRCPFCGSFHVGTQVRQVRSRSRDGKKGWRRV